MVNLIRQAKQNPNSGIAQMLINQNPQLSSMLSVANGDYKSLFMAKAAQMGIDPNLIISQIAQIK